MGLDVAEAAVLPFAVEAITAGAAGGDLDNPKPGGDEVAFLGNADQDDREEEESETLFRGFLLGIRFDFPFSSPESLRLAKADLNPLSGRRKPLPISDFLFLDSLSLPLEYSVGPCKDRRSSGLISPCQGTPESLGAPLLPISISHTSFIAAFSPKPSDTGPRVEPLPFNFHCAALKLCGSLTRLVQLERAV